jgi:hypothetical protein
MKPKKQQCYSLALIAAASFVFFIEKGKDIAESKNHDG